MSDSPTAGSNSKLRAYLELLRLPNVFTAIADVLMGFLLTHASIETAPDIDETTAYALVFGAPHHKLHCCWPRRAACIWQAWC